MMKIKDKCYFDKYGILNWEIYRYRANWLFAGVFLILNTFITYIIFFHKESQSYIFMMNSISDISIWQWFFIVVIVLMYISLFYEIFKWILLDYIIKIIFCTNELIIVYKKGREEDVIYDKIGFVNFIIADSTALHRRSSPSLSFYYKDKDLKLLDDVLYKKEELIFQGDIFTKNDYLLIKKFLVDKKIYFYEPHETLELFDQYWS